MVLILISIGRIGFMGSIGFIGSMGRILLAVDFFNSTSSALFSPGSRFRSRMSSDSVAF
jgi:hypothetical protein